MSSTDIDPSCPVNNLPLHRLDLEEVKEETNEQDLKQIAEEDKYCQLRKEASRGGKRIEEDGDGGKVAQNEPAYRSLRRSIARQEHEATEAQRPHSSHGCQSTDTSTMHSNVSYPSAAIHHRPRARSPYSWSAYRSHSANMISTSPPTATTTMSTTGSASDPLNKTHFSPAVITHNPHVQRQPPPLSKSPTLRPISPFRPPGRVRSPFRSSQLSEEQPFGAEFASISEDSELEIAPRSFPANSSTSNHGYNASYLHRCSSSPCSTSTSSSSITRSRRPNSPMRHVSAPTSAHSSPLLAPAPSNYPSHYNESYPLSLSASSATFTTTNTTSSSYYTTTMMNTPTLTALSSSSVPSTPTSARSRSPSISSLETIPDSPRAEKEAEAALAAAEEAAIAAAADAAVVAADAHQSSENTTAAAAVAGGSAGVIPRISSGSGIAVRDKRKRWSVCGAESRRDLDLETIWEDQNV